MPYSAQKKLTGRSAVAGPVVSVGRATSARMLSSSAWRALDEAVVGRGALERLGRRLGQQLDRVLAAQLPALGIDGAEGVRAAGRPRPAQVVRRPRQRANGVGTREASASAARSMSSRPSDTGAHDAITGRDRGSGPHEPRETGHVARGAGQHYASLWAARASSEGSGSRPSSWGSPRNSPSRPSSSQARDLALALDPGGVILGQAADEPGDAVADLQREVRRRGAHQLADVVDRDLVAGGLADGALGFAHGLLDCAWLVWAFLISRRESMRACVATEMARSSPTIQP